jgi:hypothetical protein
MWRSCQNIRREGQEEGINKQITKIERTRDDGKYEHKSTITQEKIVKEVAK